MKIILAAFVLCLLTLPTTAADFPICKGGHRVTCVVDGDTSARAAGVVLIG